MKSKKFAEESHPLFTDDLVRIILDEATIQAKVQELADLISSEYEGVGKDELVVVGVLKGSFIFMADLCRKLSVHHSVDFIALSSYGRSGSLHTGNVRMLMDVRENLEGKHVLIVEDILDSGYTLDYLIRNFKTRKPKSLKTIAFLRKPDCVKIDVEMDYIGFDIPDVWVVGYGLDLAEEYRTLPFLAEIKPIA